METKGKKEIEEYRREMSMLDEIGKGVKMKTLKTRKSFLKIYEIKSIDKIPMIKENLKQNIQTLSESKDIKNE